MKQKQNFTKAILAGFILGLFSFAHADDGPVSESSLPHECGILNPTGQYGPYDYTNYSHYLEFLPVVEVYHFTPEVEQLIAGESGTIYDDLAYTLRAFPNHHRALLAITKYEDSVKDANAKEKVGRNYSIDCFFRRGIVFAPSDGVVRLIYATYLHQNRKLTQAKAQYETALKINPNSSEVHYNMGLLYYDTDELGLAVRHGRKAYELGYPLQGLKNKLISKGVWDNTVSQN